MIAHRVERALVDTDVIVTAYDPARAGHHQARALLESDPRDLIVATQSFREFVDTGLASSQPIHDAHLVAVALEHRANAIITSNVRHFERFNAMIRVESLR
ncbi:hypothetical protein [Nocardioides sp.]|uniref:hypothetical protein n=1 Tax=Nocardioides sp. TaxID=35761 RepID=UPI0026178371|nr:hypothetical protein [Nocardioides sp.]